MSIVRVGMAEDPRFAEGYEAIFGKKTAKSKNAASKGTNGSPAKKPTAAASKTAAKNTKKTATKKGAKK